MPDWWRGAVVYQIYPRSFADSNADGVGDIPGITARLEYVAALGVDAIWLSPVFTSPMADFGYDVSDYCAIDPLFGTLDDFRTLLHRAHALGLRVIIDQVYSHSSDRHAWFEQSRQDRTNPKADWYVWADPKPDGTPPNNWLASFGGAAWSWEPRRRQYYLHNFLAAQPDLNLHNADVQDAILQVARFWLDLGVDGFRLDVANYYTHDRTLRDNPPRAGYQGSAAIGYQQRIHNISQAETLPFLARLRETLDSYEDRMAVAEITCENQLARVIEYTAGARHLHTAYSFALLGKPLDGAAIRATIAQILDAAGQPWPSWAFSNHDVPRVATRWSIPNEPPATTARLFLAMLLMLPGTIFLYQGEELGLPQADIPRDSLRDPEAIANWPHGLGRDGARTPMPWQDSPSLGFTTATPWLPASLAHRPLAAACQQNAPDTSLALTRRLLALRRSLPNFATAATEWHAAPPEILAFDRVTPAWRLRCIFNLSAGHPYTPPNQDAETPAIKPRDFAIAIVRYPAKR